MMLQIYGDYTCVTDATGVDSDYTVGTLSDSLCY